MDGDEPCDIQSGGCSQCTGDWWTCDNDHCVSSCGDNSIDGDEVCDDANQLSGDGCAHDCMSVEDGHVCYNDGDSGVP